VLVAGSFVLAWPRSHRGLSGVIAGLNVVDSRTHHSPSLPTTLSNTARS
jgi:hypothetical protein